MSTFGGYHECNGGYREYIVEYIGGCSVHRRDIVIHVRNIWKDIMNTSDTMYHEYIGEFQDSCGEDN